MLRGRPPVRGRSRSPAARASPVRAKAHSPSRVAGASPGRAARARSPAPASSPSPSGHGRDAAAAAPPTGGRAAAAAGLDSRLQYAAFEALLVTSCIIALGSSPDGLWTLFFASVGAAATAGAARYVAAYLDMKQPAFVRVHNALSDCAQTAGLVGLALGAATRFPGFLQATAVAYTEVALAVGAGACAFIWLRGARNFKAAVLVPAVLTVIVVAASGRSRGRVWLGIGAAAFALADPAARLLKRTARLRRLANDDLIHVAFAAGVYAFSRCVAELPE